MALLLSKPPKNDLNKPTQDIPDSIIITGTLVKSYKEAQDMISNELAKLKDRVLRCR